MLKLNGQKIKVEHFPNNETMVKNLEKCIRPGQNVLEFKYYDDSEFVKLMFVKKRLDELKVACTLFIWYMAYSRMDRKIEGDLFTLQYVCEFMNSLNFERIIVMEPHSQPTLNLLERAEAIYPVNDWLEAIKKDIGFDEERDHVVFPDKGAAARYIDSNYEEIPENSPYKNVCVFAKERNPFTGQIMNMKIKHGAVNLGSKCIIIDDLCSKGGTFAWAGSILKAAGASEVYLVVSHCEKTVFYGQLLKNDSPIDRIYTSDSMMGKRKNHPKIRYMDVDVAGYVGKQYEPIKLYKVFSGKMTF